MFEIKSPLKYFPINIGDYSLLINKNNNYVTLREKNKSWMGYDQNNHWQANEFYFELNRSHGICITTGLGLGILQTNLCLKENVEKVIVYEKSAEVIEIFLKLIKFNNFDISKIEIKNLDANEMNNEICDCLFLDHFEGNTDEEILHSVKQLSFNNKFTTLWYWPAVYHFLKFSLKKNLPLSCKTYQMWKLEIDLKNLPNIDDEDLQYFQNLKEIYQTQIKGKSRLKDDLNNLDQRNNLLALSKNFK